VIKKTAAQHAVIAHGHAAKAKKQEKKASKKYEKANNDSTQAS